MKMNVKTTTAAAAAGVLLALPAWAADDGAEKGGIDLSNRKHISGATNGTALKMPVAEFADRAEVARKADFAEQAGTANFSPTARKTWYAEIVDVAKRAGNVEHDAGDGNFPNPESLFTEQDYLQHACTPTTITWNTPNGSCGFRIETPVMAGRTFLVYDGIGQGGTSTQGSGGNKSQGVVQVACVCPAGTTNANNNCPSQGRFIITQLPNYGASNDTASGTGRSDVKFAMDGLGAEVAKPSCNFASTQDSAGDKVDEGVQPSSNVTAKVRSFVNKLTKGQPPSRLVRSLARKAKARINQSASSGGTSTQSTPMLRGAIVKELADVPSFRRKVNDTSSSSPISSTIAFDAEQTASAPVTYTPGKGWRVHGERTEGPAGLEELGRVVGNALASGNGSGGPPLSGIGGLNDDPVIGPEDLAENDETPEPEEIPGFLPSGGEAPDDDGSDPGEDPGENSDDDGFDVDQTVPPSPIPGDPIN